MIGAMARHRVQVLRAAGKTLKQIVAETGVSQRSVPARCSAPQRLHHYGWYRCARLRARFGETGFMPPSHAEFEEQARDLRRVSIPKLVIIAEDCGERIGCAVAPSTPTTSWPRSGAAGRCPSLSTGGGSESPSASAGFAGVR